MGTKEKLIERFLTLPKNFTYGYLGYLVIVKEKKEILLVHGLNL